MAKKIYSCEKDIEMAIDDFLLAEETFPLLSSDCNEKCCYCEKQAIYVLSKESLSEK